jgi:hypothetical protein
LTAEATALENEIEHEREMIRNAADPAQQAELEKAETEARIERDRLAGEHRVLEDADLQLQVEEADLDAQDSDLALQVEAQKETMRALGLRERNARKLIESLTVDLEAAEQRCAALTTS